MGTYTGNDTERVCDSLYKESLKLNDVKVYGNLDSMVKCAAVCTGSGKSMIKDVIKAGADVYVTGDIDHHTGIDTVAQGLALIDAGHYGTEYIFMDAMKKRTDTGISGTENLLCRGKEPVHDSVIRVLTI